MPFHIYIDNEKYKFIYIEMEFYYIPKKPDTITFKDYNIIILNI